MTATNSRKKQQKKKYYTKLLFLLFLSTIKINHYSMIERAQIGYYLYTGKEESLKNAMLKPIKDTLDYDKLEVAYSYLIDNYNLSLAGLEQLGNNFNKYDEFDTYHDSLFNDAVNAIYNYKIYGQTSGHIQLGILSDLLPEVDILGLILTGHEEVIIKELNNKYFKDDKLKGLLINDFFYDLEKIEQINDLNMYQYCFSTSQVSKILSNYPTGGMKKEIMTRLINNFDSQSILEEQSYLPYWSLFSNKKGIYPILVTNKYFNNYEIEISNNDNLTPNVEKTLNQKGFQSIIANMEKLEFDNYEFKNQYYYTNEIIRLLGILAPEDTTIIENESKEEYVYRLNEIFKDDINIYQLSLGLDTQQQKSQKKYIALYFKKLSEREITIKDVYDINFIISCFSPTIYTERNMTKEERLVQLGLLNDSIAQMQNILMAQQKENLVFLLNNPDISYKYYNPLINDKRRNEIVNIRYSLKEGNTYIFYVPEFLNNLRVRLFCGDATEILNIEEMPFCEVEALSNGLLKYAITIQNNEEIILNASIKDYYIDSERINSTRIKKN